VLITIAKFDCLVSCSTNPNDYLIIWRNRSQIFEALTINPEKQTKGERGMDMRQWRISWAFFHEGHKNKKKFLFLLISISILH